MKLGWVLARGEVVEYERGSVDKTDDRAEDQESAKGLWIDFGKHCGRRSCCENNGAKRQAEDCSMGVSPRRPMDFNGSIISRQQCYCVLDSDGPIVTCTVSPWFEKPAGANISKIVTKNGKVITRTAIRPSEW